MGAAADDMEETFKDIDMDADGKIPLDEILSYFQHG